VKFQDVVEAWDGAFDAIHPSREHESEEAYWESGREQAQKLMQVFKDGSRIVDFGCGDGRVAIPLHRRNFARVIGVDSSSKMIEALREREPSLPALVNDGTGLAGLLDRKVDGLYCLAVLIHHDYADGERLVGELARAVRKGGLLVLDWPTSEAPGERQAWIEVTTWPKAWQAQIGALNGLERVENDLPWSTWKMTR
jgi:SAM-dependent methyltransferase